MQDFLEILESNKAYFNYPETLQTLLINSEIPIYFLEELENIKTINICGDNDAEQKEIIDYSELNKFKNLETLVIVDNKNIETLDISSLKKLRTLVLLNNNSLENIKGLENLKKLDTIIIVGNKIKEIDKSKVFIENISKSKIVRLDINMYQCLRKNDIINKNKTNIQFAEKISVGQFYNLTLEMMEKLYTSAQEILDNIISVNNYEILKEIYKYIVKTVKYDYEELEKRNMYILEGNLITAYQNEYKDINSCYKAIIEKKAVCEGYANALKFLASLRNIEVENIACFLNENNKSFEFYNHTASRVKINSEWLYCDSQIEINPEALKYFLLTETEFEKTHMLQNEKQKGNGEKNEKHTIKKIFNP